MRGAACDVRSPHLLIIGDDFEKEPGRSESQSDVLKEKGQKIKG